MRLALAQMNTVVGDLDGNRDRILARLEEARGEGADLAGAEIKARYRKRFLPNYGVFDEDRYFAPGRDLVLLELGETLIGPTVCEDIWQPGPPATDLALAGAELIVNISASPFHVGR